MDKLFFRGDKGDGRDWCLEKCWVENGFKDYWSGSVRWKGNGLERPSLGGDMGFEELLGER